MSIPIISPADYAPTSEQEADLMHGTFSFSYIGLNIDDNETSYGTISDFSWSVLIYSHDELLTNWLDSFDSSLDSVKEAIEIACDGLALRATIYAP